MAFLYALGNIQLNEKNKTENEMTIKFHLSFNATQTETWCKNNKLN